MKVFVTVGTDTHRFDRLVEWSDALAGMRRDLSVVVQYGRSAAPRIATGVAYLDHLDLLAELRGSQLVITHGGPASIMEAREWHGRPIVVPRDPALDEHVDGHQLAFGRMLAGHGLVTLVTTLFEFVAGVTAHVAGAASSGSVAGSCPEGVDRFAEEVWRLLDTGGAGVEGRLRSVRGRRVRS